MAHDTTLRPILLTGTSGQVGAALLPRLRALGPVAAPSRTELDLADTVALRRMLQALKPRWIVNPAAYTAVDRAEQDAAAAWAINAQAPGVLGEAARSLGIPVVHLSTDYVFSGAGTRPWKETDATGPLNVYGRSKLAGEQALAASGAAHVVLRTSWVYAAAGQNFLRTMLRLGREREELRIVADQHGTPTAAEDLAALVVFLMQRYEAKAATAAAEATNKAAQLEDAVRHDGGVVHAASRGEATTWFGFAEAIFGELKLQRPGARVPRLKAIPSAEYPTPAARPGNSRLDCSLLENRFGYKMPEWRIALRRVMGEVLAAEETTAEERA